MGLFGLGKKQATFGLDIGSSSVKVVELVEGRGGFILEAFARVPLPRDVIADGAIREPGIVAEAVKEALDKAGIKGRSAVISVSGREAITKRVPLPKVGAKELADAIVLEAEHHIPFAVDDVFLDYQVVGECSEHHGRDAGGGEEGQGARVRRGGGGRGHRADSWWISMRSPSRTSTSSITPGMAARRWHSSTSAPPS